MDATRRRKKVTTVAVPQQDEHRVSIHRNRNSVTQRKRIKPPQASLPWTILLVAVLLSLVLLLTMIRFGRPPWFVSSTTNNAADNQNKNHQPQTRKGRDGSHLRAAMDKQKHQQQYGIHTVEERHRPKQQQQHDNRKPEKRQQQKHDEAHVHSETTMEDKKEEPKPKVVSRPENKTIQQQAQNQENKDGNKKRLRFLFVHQNFPGQFRHLAPALAKDGHDVRAFYELKSTDKDLNFTQVWKGVTIYRYSHEGGKVTTTPGAHYYLGDLEAKMIRGDSVRHAAIHLRDGTGPWSNVPGSPFHPDAIIGHPGWGEMLFIDTAFPKAKLGVVFEFYFGTVGPDSGWDPEFASNEPCPACKFKVRNMFNHLQPFDAAVSATQWQRSTFPPELRDRIDVIFEGVNTQTITPNPNATANLTVAATHQKIVLNNDKDNPWDVVTFVTRTLEPIRGYHTFMRALPRLLKERPNVRVIVIGRDRQGYTEGPDPRKYNNLTTWKEIYRQEIIPKLDKPEDLHRIHLVGQVPQPTLHSIMQISKAHVYLSGPFVLSWSLIESMSVGCPIVASDTAPLQEPIQHNETGLKVNFFDPNDVTDKIIYLLDHPQERQRLGTNARKFAIEHYDLERICLPKLKKWVHDLVLKR